MCHTYTDRQTEKQRQTETDSHKQRQAEIDRNKHRKAEASRDRQRQIETDRDKQRQIEIDVRMWHCGCIPLAGKILGISLAIDVIDIMCRFFWRETFAGFCSITHENALKTLR